MQTVGEGDSCFVTALYQAQLIHKEVISYSWSLARYWYQVKASEYVLRRQMSEVLGTVPCSYVTEKSPEPSARQTRHRAFTPTVSRIKMYLVIYTHLVSEEA